MNLVFNVVALFCQLENFFDKRADAIVDFVEFRVAHKCWCRDDLVGIVHESLLGKVKEQNSKILCKII